MREKRERRGRERGRKGERAESERRGVEKGGERERGRE